MGRYHILEQLGEGGMAVVYKAYDTRLERNVAIKAILQDKQQSEKFLKRFEREAKALASLGHPNIVSVIDYGEQDGIPYLVMQYVPGGTLRAQLNGRAIPWQDAVQLLALIGRALACAHNQKIIHRDVKPSNILITQSGQPMLSDFGIAKMLEADETVDLTGTGVGVGTPEYMSPEQAQGRPVDGRSDIYSLGVIFYEMITGRKPYRADTPYAVAIKQVNEPLPAPRKFVPELPEDVERFLLKALAKEPENRHTSMQEFTSAMEGLGRSQSQTISVRSRRAWLRIGLGVVLAAGLVGAGAGLIRLASSSKNLSGSVWLGKPLNLPAPTPLPLAATGNVQTYLAREDFEGNKINLPGYSADSNSWQIVDDGTGNKVFQVDHPTGGAYFASFAFGEDYWGDYAVQYRLRFLRSNGDVGIQVRATGDKYYVVDLIPSELYLAYPGPSQWERIATKFPSIALNTWDTIRITVHGQDIQVFIDESKWIDAVDSKYQHGGLLMFASAGTLAQVDDIKVWQYP